MSVARSSAVHFHAESLTESFMDFWGQPRGSGACNFLGVPVLSSWDVDDDEGEVVIGIRPKSSPLPRRKSSVSDEDSEPEPPMCGSRRVSFADAKGLNLVQVKEFDTWDVPKLPGYDTSDGEGNDEDEYILSPLNFSLPLLTEELLTKVQEQKVELEKIELLPGTTIVKGVVRVLNISFTKAIYVRTTLDCWSSHFDLLAEYIPGSSDGLTDCFSFTLTLWPPFRDEGARVDFCLRYETPVGTFWANNANKNYVLSCFRRTKENDQPQKENVNKKSCLKTASPNTSVENSSGKESSTQGNIAADVSNTGLEGDTLKSRNDQSGISEEHGQKLLIESGVNDSQRSRRKAARMARVRDYFAQRNGDANNTDRDESPPGVTQAAGEETPKEKHTDVRLFAESNRKPQGSQAKCSEPLLSLSRDMSPALDRTSEGEPEKSESIALAASVTLAEGESATDIQDDLFDNFAQAEQQHTKSQDSSQVADVGHEYISSTAAERNESLVGQTSSFTFGTVVAPLYHQVFGRVGSESQRGAGWENPARATLSIAGLHPHTGMRQISCTVSTDIKSNNSKALQNAINNQKSNQECTDIAPCNNRVEEEEASLSLTLNAETLQDPSGTENTDWRCTCTLKGSQTCLEDTLSCPETVNILSQADLLNPQIPAESLHPWGEAQEDSVTHDPQGQITAETTQCPLPENPCTHDKTNLDEMHAKSDTHEVRTSPQTSFVELESSWDLLGHVNEGPDQQSGGLEEKRHECELIKALCPGNASFSEVKPCEDLHKLNLHHNDNSVTKATVPDCKLVEKSDFTTPKTLLEARGETNNMGEGSKMTHSSLKDESKSSGETEVTGELAECVTTETQEKTEHCKIKAKEEALCLGEITEVKDWEMMVEEEENNILIHEDESEIVYLNPGVCEVREKEIANEEVVKGRAVTGVEEDRETIGEAVSGEDGASTEVECAQVIKMDKTGGREELTEENQVQETEGPVETELRTKKHFAGKEVSIERAHIQENEEIKGDGKINLNKEGEGGAEREKEPKEGNGAVEAELVESHSCVAKQERKDPELCLEEKLEITGSKDEEVLSALVNSGQEFGGESVPVKESIGEEQSAHIQTEKQCLHTTKPQSEDGNGSAAAEGDALTDEPEGDQTSQDSASAESDSGDEVELYIHCLRAVGTGGRSHEDKSTVSKRPRLSRTKLLSATMPPITESQDEEQHLSRLQEKLEEAKIADSATVSPAEESMGQSVSCSTDTFSCSNITKSLLYATLLVVFLVVAYHYDFLACLGLYLISVVWLCCREEKQPVKNDNTIG
ncbi:uncharacterized protein ppp1r3ab [Oreochromis niloticus]|uniref:Uncharacterized LOC102076116 n=1 Tax=Oreochromis niloticus TaxID=8128 RepID=A0A669E599_ORENI|nr:uncharacterized protein LOC102076116 [Oreochromis niloticus]